MKTLGEWVDEEEWVEPLLLTLERAGDLPATPAAIRFAAAQWRGMADGLDRRAKEMEQEADEDAYAMRGEK
jgi:hypothetical protein